MDDGFDILHVTFGVDEMGKFWTRRLTWTLIRNISETLSPKHRTPSSNGCSAICLGCSLLGDRTVGGGTFSGLGAGRVTPSVDGGNLASPKY